MPFDPQNELEHSLMKAASDPAHRPQFYRDLASADLFIIQEGPPPATSGKTVLKESQTIQIRHMEWNGKNYIPVFSSLPRLQAVLREEAGYLALNAIEFMKITQGAEFILNPGSDFGKEFTKQEISSLIDGSIWQPTERYVAKEAAQVMIGQPANYPKELADALTRYFKTQKGVKRVFLAHFFHPQRDEKAHTLIAVEFTGEWEPIMAGAGIVARDVHVPDPPVDFLPMTGKDGIEDYFRRDCKPFYERKLFGLF
ncbi:MAG: enhanced serine sensitivity protein SseB C-terminal domain-containing protein [Luteolibacter sp.]